MQLVACKRLHQCSLQLEYRNAGGNAAKKWKSDGTLGCVVGVESAYMEHWGTLSVFRKIINKKKRLDL